MRIMGYGLSECRFRVRSEIFALYLSLPQRFRSTRQPAVALAQRVLTSETDIRSLRTTGADNGFTTKKFLTHVEPTVRTTSISCRPGRARAAVTRLPPETMETTWRRTPRWKTAPRTPPPARSEGFGPRRPRRRGHLLYRRTVAHGHSPHRGSSRPSSGRCRTARPVCGPPARNLKSQS